MKKAMAMIELVFAIVIMGIAVMSLPLILTQVQNSNSFALRQEVILSIKTKLSYILAYQWDQNTYDATADIERVLNVLNIPASADTATDFNTSTIRRKGHVLADGRRRLWDDLNASTPKANFGTVGMPLDIDDFDGKNENKTITALDDFIYNLTLRTTVNYMIDTLPVGNSYVNNGITFIFDPDNNTTNRTNIKMIQVTATATGLDNPISMFAFSSNIGQSKVAKKRW